MDPVRREMVGYVVGLRTLAERLKQAGRDNADDAVNRCMWAAAILDGVDIESMLRPLDEEQHANVLPIVESAIRETAAKYAGVLVTMEHASEEILNAVRKDLT